MANTNSLDLELSSSQYADRADTTSLSITGDLTIECWVKLEQLPSTVGTRFNAVTKYKESTNERSYRLTIESTNDKPLFVNSSDGTSANTTSAAATTALTAGVWTHLAVSYNAAAGTCAFYRNGVADGTGASLKTSIHDNASRFALGAINTDVAAVEFYDGLIDEVRIWNDIRTATEILTNYQAELLGSEQGLVAYYKLNNVYTDSTTNANDLTASGSPVFSTDVPFVGGGSGLQNKIW